MGFFNVLYGIGKAGVKGTAMVVKANKEGKEASELALKKAFMETDMEFSCQKEMCTVKEDVDSYVTESKNMFDIMRIIAGIFWLVVLVFCIIKYNEGDVFEAFIMVLPFVEVYRFGQSLAQPLVRPFLKYETILKKKHGFSALKLIIPGLYGLIMLFGFMGGEMMCLVTILVMVLIGFVGYFRQHFKYIYKSYATDLKDVFVDREMLTDYTFNTVREIKITNTALYFNGDKQRILRWYDLTDFGTTALAKCYCDKIASNGHQFSSKVMKKYINGNDVKRNKFSKKRKKVKEATDTSCHAGVTTRRSGYILSEIIISKLEPQSSNRLATKTNETQTGIELKEII